MKTRKRFTSLLVSAIAVTIMLFANVSNTFAQDNGALTNYCIPRSAQVTANAQIFGTDLAWCYNDYMKWASTYYMYYFTEPIHEVKITETNSGEVHVCESRTDKGYSGSNAGTFEGCYVGIDKTIVRGEMSPGETYNMKFTVLNNYYGYNGTNYCIYSYTSTFNIRIFLDLNINGKFEETEWSK